LTSRRQQQLSVLFFYFSGNASRVGLFIKHTSSCCSIGTRFSMTSALSEARERSGFFYYPLNAFPKFWHVFIRTYK